MQFFSEKKIYDFMRMRFAAISLSFILFFGSIYLLWDRGLQYGIDFSGGTLVQLKYENAAPITQIREILEKQGTFQNLSVTEFGSNEEVTIRFLGSNDNVSNDIGEHISTLLKDTGKFEVRRADVVGPKVGDELRNKGLMAIAVSLIAILIYIALRFEWRFALAAIISEIHDVVITLGAISLFKIDVNLDTLAAVLTVLGYSLNDTIIIFDRIREGIKTSKKTELAPIINESVSATLSRTVLTSGLTLATVVILYFFGGEMIQGFSLALIVGIIAGTLSSIFVASPTLLWFKFSVLEFRNKEIEKAKRKQDKERNRAMYEKGTV
ncbi:protein translocase subunit SecF [Campylobacter jejuni]|uniref:Protein-export membrane protein SecF n=3 Tax=Campylobacter jejuni TaxID=197 RepID=A0A1E7PAY0_CAMJU|nr:MULTISPECIES: protein translocase subunit SecF [Campylobacter]EAJ6189478.1 protein translocase subunit SecF [Campylobacter fetus]EAK5449491.1 protein translocase subunit SecF [Campylobacter hyointestinalis]EDK22579.1 protein-export membrane protein [Campylobacter jejuni subsp. jejuni CG8486]EEG5257185.1 protein translocase subunit SecF [Salmonella enterica subsp. enterica serovar Typhi]EFV11173.1 protein-export membrane protein SecF [Campylobacter jejuni subsp. jejuni 327]ETJ82134.1 prepro